MDRQLLLVEIHAGRERLRAAFATVAGRGNGATLERIDDEWTRKDVIAHIEAWERRVVDLFERLRAGEAPPDAVETDALNARFHAADRERTLDDVVDGEEAAWQRLLAAVDGATDDELFDGDRFPWTEGDPFADWIHGNADEHFDEHLEQLTRPARS